MYIMTHLAREAEADGFDKVFNAAEAATKAIEVRSNNCSYSVCVCVCVCVCDIATLQY